jgi:hypothetical protein
MRVNLHSGFGGACATVFDERAEMVPAYVVLFMLKEIKIRRKTSSRVTGEF